MTDTSIQAQGGGVLVAHDGSASAADATRVAARHANALGVPLTVVRMWSIATAPRPESWEFGYVPPIDDFAASTLVELEKDLADIRSTYPDLPVTAEVVHGRPVPKLVEASSRFELLVMGSRGRGGFKGMLLGSVSEQLVRHAECPVLIVRNAAGSAATNEAPKADVELDQLERALISELKQD